MGPLQSHLRYKRMRHSNQMVRHLFSTWGSKLHLFPAVLLLLAMLKKSRVIYINACKTIRAGGKCHPQQKYLHDNDEKRFYFLNYHTHYTHSQLKHHVFDHSGPWLSTCKTEVTQAPHLCSVCWGHLHSKLTFRYKGQQLQRLKDHLPISLSYR